MMIRTVHSRQGFTLIEMVLVVAIIAILAAMAIPSLLSARGAANETSAIGTLRNLVTVETTWRQNDTDRNTVGDWWTADLSGLYRIESRPASGIGVAVIDVAVATADEAKEAGGAAVVGAPIPATTVSAASLLDLTRSGPKSGYYYSCMPAFRADPDGNLQTWTNTSSFGFQARPDVYYNTGVNTFIVNEAGVIFSRDFGNSLIANAAVWPGPNPTTVGYKIAQ